ncbi:MAG: hypothetical protein HC840_30495 [Leptolyngbyaceae cyanobacterium RM2_2_4]|nr:hypothetical protein [Leptolyngbyaceae cyanobacterium SM1_4_3]NJO53006.1 hypothetical protein [Leptolyngbyaceae cyanobacterium RM2_2_4]NJO76199.1 hypothetical protein [Leptolyngbyaceae cyanobacterium RM1_406_9]
MARYTLDELETAVSDEYRNNSNFRKDVNKAIETKNQNWLSDLVKWVADKLFGAVIESLIAAVVGALWNG